MSFYGIASKATTNHLRDAQSLFYNSQIVMLSLVGSQNYGLANETSDYDTKCCILPTWEDIIEARQPYSHTFIRENNEHIDFTDFRSMMNILRKQNVNFLEQLFATEYFINETYSKEIEKLKQHREAIAHYNPCKCVQTMVGIAKSKESRVLRPLRLERDEVFERFNYHPKELAQLYRIYCFLYSYTSGLTFEDSLKNIHRKEYLRLKTEKLPIEEVKETVEIYMLLIKEMEQDFLESNEATYLPEIDSLMIEVTESIFKKYLKQFM